LTHFHQCVSEHWIKCFSPKSMYVNDSVNGAPHHDFLWKSHFLFAMQNFFMMPHFILSHLLLLTLCFLVLQMKYQEDFFHNQIEHIHKATEDKEKMFEKLLQEERSKARRFDVDSGTIEDRMLRYKTIWFHIIVPLTLGIRISQKCFLCYVNQSWNICLGLEMLCMTIVFSKETLYLFLPFNHLA
jgi:hypothetical protein